MDKAYLGVDVGNRGCIACQCDGKWEWYYICEMDYYQIANVFRSLREKYTEIACVIEDVRAIHGSASTATFAFGENKGFLIGINKFHLAGSGNVLTDRTNSVYIDNGGF